MTKKLKLALASLMTLALCLTTLPVSVMADPVDPDAITEAYVTKVLKVPSGIVFTNYSGALDFEFTITPYSFNGDKTVASTMPGLTFVTSGANTVIISFDGNETAADIAVPNGYDNYYAEEKIDLDAVTWSLAGIYIYEIVETVPATNPAFLGDDVTADGVDYEDYLHYSEAVYYLYVVIEECNTAGCPDHQVGALYIFGVYGFKAVDDFGDDFTDTLGKVDTSGGAYGLAFTNTIDRIFDTTTPTDGKGFLYIQKDIVGGTVTSFDFTVTVTQPATVDNTSVYWAAVMQEDILNPGTWLNVTNVNDSAGTSAYGLYIEFISGVAKTGITLEDGQRLVFFSGLEASATYAVAEAGAVKYYPFAVVYLNGEAYGNAKGGWSSTVASPLGIPVVYLNVNDPTADATPIPNLYVGDIEQGDSYALFTNTYSEDPPTGLNLNTLAFVGLIVLAVGGLVLFVAIKSRKRKDNQEEPVIS
jgi:hypothetical protein